MKKSTSSLKILKRNSFLTLKLKDLKSHSNRIKFLRKLLPIIAIFLVVMIFIWPAAKRLLEGAMEDFPKISKELIVENKVINPRIISTDNKGQPYEMRADSASQVDKQKTDMSHPKSTMTMAQGGKVEINSNKGIFDKNTNCMTYQDDVKLQTSEGYKFSAQKVDVDVKEQYARCDDPIQGDGPGGKIEAQGGIDFDKHTNKMYFKGQTRLILNTK